MTSLSKFCDDIDTVLLLSCRRLGAVMLSLAMMVNWSLGKRNILRRANEVSRVFQAAGWRRRGAHSSVSGVKSQGKVF